MISNGRDMAAAQEGVGIDVAEDTRVEDGRGGAGGLLHGVETRAGRASASADADVAQAAAEAEAEADSSRQDGAGGAGGADGARDDEDVVMSGTL